MLLVFAATTEGQGSIRASPADRDEDGAACHRASRSSCLPLLMPREFRRVMSGVGCHAGYTALEWRWHQPGMRLYPVCLLLRCRAGSFAVVRARLMLRIVGVEELIAPDPEEMSSLRACCA